ncbi:MAG: hypothetical protein LUD00_09135 [Prevotellaceae bacterium]|nr:hypothetical protein [Prevotellaceae bacterium]
MAYMFMFCFHGIRHEANLYGDELLGNVLGSSYYVGFCVLLVLTYSLILNLTPFWTVKMPLVLGMLDK